ncbi:SDR family NAD(P)-dependent oxidoreductase, partial [Nocardia brasiliensis]|uniref:SDR family NAD(P)-dependent oxidoreductase n=1 Tax=Nocardia brasiliensis TaxID=37326 RepID=UPI002457EDDD
RRSGRIINVASALGLTGGADEVAYATAKAAVIGFTRSVAQEVGRRGRGPRIRGGPTRPQVRRRRGGPVRQVDSRTSSGVRNIGS